MSCGGKVQTYMCLCFFRTTTMPHFHFQLMHHSLRAHFATFTWCANIISCNWKSFEPCQEKVIKKVLFFSCLLGLAVHFCSQILLGLDLLDLHITMATVWAEEEKLSQKLATSLISLWFVSMGTFAVSSNSLTLYCFTVHTAKSL